LSGCRSGSSPSVEQQSLFNASVVLIEDKASGTQLIQDLIAPAERSRA
jgi:hypothetical protein